MIYAKGKLNSELALIDNPDLLSDPKIAAEVSVLYFLDRVKLAQTDSGYFESASHAVGSCTADIYATKKGFYECFYAQLSGTVLGAGSGGIVVDGSGNPIKTGQ